MSYSMKKITLSMMLLAALLLCNCAADDDEAVIKIVTQEMNEQKNQSQTAPNEGNNATAVTQVSITIGDMTKQMSLADNAAAKSLAAKLQQAPLSLTLNSSGGFEIWGALGFSLPTSNEQINAQPGDVVLYNGSNICLFYGSNSWSYTRLGHISGLSENELKSFLKAGERNISVILSVTND